MKTHYQVVIIGGGTGGIMTAAMLKKKSPATTIAIVEPTDKHLYQPAYTLVAAGTFDMADTERDMSSVIPKGVFEVSLSYPELKLYVKKEYISEDQEMFLRSINSKEDAKKIISIVNSWEGTDGMVKLKNFYRRVLKYHHPEYFMMIKNM